MEDTYILISDCVHNLSNLFTFHHLLQLSTTQKQNSSCIYELSIHDHDNQPIYYTSTYQINKFHNIHTLTISKYYSYVNLTKLTHINNVRFYDFHLLEYITNLTNLTSCHCMQYTQGSFYFHTNLIKLYDFNRNFHEYNISDIMSHTQLTNLDVNQLHNQHLYKDLTSLLTFTNLRSLTTDYLINMSEISQLKLLEKLTLETNVNNNDFCIVINHSFLTYFVAAEVEAGEIQTCLLQNCHKLKYLELWDCKICALSSYSQLQTLLIYTYYNDLKIEFDVKKCINLQYLKFNHNIVDMEDLKSCVRLNSLFISYSEKINISDIVAEKITHLYIDSCPGKQRLNLEYFINLKILSLCSTLHTNINKLTQLEHLTLCASSDENDFGSIDFVNHLYLTYLEMTNDKFINLHLLTKLYELNLSNYDARDSKKVWKEDILHLHKLTSLDLSFQEVTLHGKYLSRCVSLKHFSCNCNVISLDCISNNLNDLDIPYCESNMETINTLTKLTYLDFLRINNHVHGDLKNLIRLNCDISGQEHLMCPKIKIIE